MLDAGHAESHVLKVHRILFPRPENRPPSPDHRRERGDPRDPPTVDETETNPFSIEEAKAFLEAAAKRPTFMRWGRRRRHGFRQGEALGFRWKYVDLDNELFHPQWQLQSPGRLTAARTPTPVATAPIRPLPARLHDRQELKRGRPKPCPKDCTKHAEHMPTGRRTCFTRPKTKKSRNSVPIRRPSSNCRTRPAAQEEMRTAAGDEWQEHDALFAGRTAGRSTPATTGRSSRTARRGR
ncbi:site-specific integrase [Streptomyces purpurascens]